MSGIFNPLQDNNQLTIDYATYELSLVLASGSPLVLESGGFNINLGTGIINNGGALEFDTTIGYNFSGEQTFSGQILMESNLQLNYNAIYFAGIGDSNHFIQGNNGSATTDVQGNTLPANSLRLASYQYFSLFNTSAKNEPFLVNNSQVQTLNNILDNGSGLATLTTLNLVNVLDAQYINISNTLINNGGALDVNIDNTYIIENSGVLSINLTENYIWTGNHTFPNSIYDFDAALSIAYLQMIIGIQAKPSGAGMDLSGTFTAGGFPGGTFTPSQNYVYVIINTIQNTGTNLIVQLEDLTTGAYLECIAPPNMPNTTTLSKVFLCQSQVSTSNTYQFHINGGFNGTLVWNATANY